MFIISSVYQKLGPKYASVPVSRCNGLHKDLNKCLTFVHGITSSYKLWFEIQFDLDCECDNLTFILKMFKSAFFQW